ncbi:hypothetical protein KAR91_21165, partial [Candidatus Pacearchaeota archaeon]|nr:hypothetical protein [Candidatus Pacearchaeota archaeon]
MMLTIEMLKAMPCGTIFATGKAIDSPEGLFVTNQRQVHHWVAKRGGGASDWALYYVIYTKNWDNEDISKFGAKVIG